MNKDHLRKRFAELAGPEKLDRFMAALHRNPVCRTRLLFWQEKLWERFRLQEGLPESTHPQILDLFTFCHRHGRELAEGVPEGPASYYDEHRERSSYFYRNAYQRVEARCFPFAAHREPETAPGKPGRARHCPDCRDEKGRYIRKEHHGNLSLEDRDKYVCDIEQEALEIYARLGEDSGVGRLEGLALYYFERRPTGTPVDPVLAGLADRLEETGRALLAGTDLFLEDDAFHPLREYLRTGSGARIDPHAGLEELKALFTLEVEQPGDQRILERCRWMFFVLGEIWSETGGASGVNRA